MEHLFPNYHKGESLAHTWIHWPCLRVSTVSFPSNAGCPDALIETWIFSECPKQKSRQIFHRSREKAVKAHERIVTNMRQLIKQ